jgi:hypothetical protein
LYLGLIGLCFEIGIPPGGICRRAFLRFEVPLSVSDSTTIELVQLDPNTDAK